MQSDAKGNWHDSKDRFMDKPKRIPNDVAPPMPYQSARDRCIEYAKRQNIDLIWKAASIEVRGLTFPETEEIYAGVNPENDQEVRKVLTVNNIKRAWEFLLEHSDDWLDWHYLSEYNRICGQYLEKEPGAMRNRPVSITGTDWQPAVMVHPDDVLRDIGEAMDEETPSRRATHLFAVACRGQWFFNGNKRTATMGANHVIIHDGGGVFALPPQKIDTEFSDELLRYYETNDLPRIMDWLEYHAIGHIEDDGRTSAQLDGVDE